MTLGGNKNFQQGWVVTNTKFSSDAVQYGTCMGLHLIGWNFPSTGSLNQLVESAGLYPLTCLTTLTRNEKQTLLENNIVLCREICDNPAILKSANISESRFKNILEESLALCKPNNAGTQGVTFKTDFGQNIDRESNEKVRNNIMKANPAPICYESTQNH